MVSCCCASSVASRGSEGCAYEAVIGEPWPPYRPVNVALVLPYALGSPTSRAHERKAPRRVQAQMPTSRGRPDCGRKEEQIASIRSGGCSTQGGAAFGEQ